MFTPAHRTYVLLTTFCASLLFGAVSVMAQTEESVEVTPATQNPVVGTYPIEGIPGDGGVVGDFVIGPGKVDLTLKPGESQTVQILVTNRTGERRQFNLSVEDATGSQDSNTPIVLLGSDRGPYSVKDYLSFPYASFELDHNQRATIPVTITIPPNASPGGHYGSVLVETISIKAKPGDTGGTVPQSAIIARIGTLFFITIPGAVERDGNLKDFTTLSEKRFYQEGPIKFGILYENRGSMHLAPYGELRITNMFGDEIGYLVLEPWFVLPQALRLREVTWDREFLFGRYTATVQVNRSYDDIIDEMSYTFWVLPWKPIAGAFGVLFLVFFIIRFFFRNFEFKRKS